MTVEISNAVRDRILSQFAGLRKALIDASSIIYMERAGFFASLAAAITLVSPEEVLAETGFETMTVHAITNSPQAVSNDDKLVFCALTQKLPVISEDRKVLMRLDQEKVPYFNALMMLNYLLFRGDISCERHSDFYERLRGCSWYSESVLAFSKGVYRSIINHFPFDA